MQHAIQFDQDPSQESGDMRDNAERWMRANPDAMTLLESLAMDAHRRGQHIGMKMLAERIRWEFAVERGDSHFKVNNSHVAYIARALVDRQPCLAETLRFRRTVYERSDA